jgi:hypothetical protein
MGASDAVSVAGVHATIIGIFAAIAVTYLGIHLNSLHAIRQGIIDRANEVGRRRARLTIRHPAESDDYNGEDSVARRQHVANIDAIANKLPAWILPWQGESPETRLVDPTVPGPEQPVDRAGHLVQTLSLLTRTYPLHGAQLVSARQVRAWLEDCEYVVHRTSSSLEIGESYVASIVAEAGADWESGVRKDRAKWESGAREDGVELTAKSLLLDYVTRVGNPASQFDTLANEVSTLSGMIAGIRSEVGRYDGYLARLPSRRRIVTVVAATMVAFVTGVVVPLADTGMPRWIYVGVPCSLYAIGLVAALVAGWEYPWREPDARRTAKSHAGK